MKKNILISLLLALGLILSEISPPLLAGMRCDFLLCFIFIAIIISRDPKSTLLIGILGGIFSALVSSFPGGELPNMIEKIVVSFYVYLLVRPLSDRVSSPYLVFLALTGSFLSGGLFLLLAKSLLGIDLAFKSLFLTVVLPAALINALGTVFIYRLMEKSMALAGFKLDDI